MSSVRLECPVCGDHDLHGFLVRQGVPVYQNLLCRTREESLAVPRGNLDFAVCGTCGFVFNRAFDASVLTYQVQYENTQSCSEVFRRHEDDRLADLVGPAGVRGMRVLEVGCGQGRFLRRLVEPAELNNTGIGFDPSYAGPQSDLGGRLTFRRCMFDADMLREPADVAVARHVIEHVAEPVTFLKSVSRGLQGKGRLFIETPCVEWILERRVLWDFFYEHCSLFSTQSLSSASSQAGLVAEKVCNVFGGQYLWLTARPTEAPQRDKRNPRCLVELALVYGQSEHETLFRLRMEMERLSTRGPTAIWGAGAKGVTLANLLDPQGRQVQALIDINTAKQGCFVPGTGHPIIGPEELSPRGIRQVILTNPNYCAEIRQLVENVSPATELVEISL